MGEDSRDFAARLSEIHAQLDYPPGVMAGVLAVPILDPILGALEPAVTDSAAPLEPEVVIELERLADLLVVGMLGTSPEAIQRRVRVIDVLRCSDRGRLPVQVADRGDAFGLDLRAMLETDDELRGDLGVLFPLIVRATAVAPSQRWTRDAAAVLDAAGNRQALIAAVQRVVAALVRANIVSRPDILAGGLRLANQRFARGLLWLVSAADDGSVATLEAVGLRMGTSGRRDAVVRDVALANTAAALLGESADPAAAAALASMRMEITNRNVLKQVDRALAVRATREGLTVDELVDASLPTFGLDSRGRLEIKAGSATARIELWPDGHVGVLWTVDGDAAADAPPSIEAAAPGLVADVRARADRITAAVAEERRRLEQRLASDRSWSLDRWAARFGDHPVARVLGRTLIWTVGSGRRARAALPADGSWITVDEAPLAVADADEVRLWHPADVPASEVGAWRATLAARGVSQAVRHADREVFGPLGSSPVADIRYAGRIVDQPRLRALLRSRGWAVPALGAWDQGDEATAWRDFGGGLRAELRYQNPERTPTGERVARARLVAVRFIRADTGHSGDQAGVPVRLVDVTPRVFSEAIRDVSLAATIA